MTAAVPTLDVEAAKAAISAADPTMAAFIKQAGPYEPRNGEGDYFGSLVRAIIFQQLAGRAAAAIQKRVIEAVGGSLTPAAVLATNPEALRGAALAPAKAAALTDLAPNPTE